MARTKGSKNRATVIMEKLIAEGMDSIKAKIKGKKMASAEKVLAAKTSPARKRSKKSGPSKVPKDFEYPSVLEGYNPTTKRAWKNAKFESPTSRKKAIRANCLMCMGGSTKDVRDCDTISCPFHQFRITG